MKRSDFESALRQYEAELARQDAKRSTGSMGKYMDVLVRDFILKQGICRLNDVRCRKGGAVDVGRRGLGKFEVKTGSGAVAYGYGFTKEDLTAEVILPDADFVVWAPFPQFLNRQNFPTMFWVFTREAFIDALEAIGKKGLQSSLKISKGGAQVNIQTITPRMEDRLWEVLEATDTLESFMEELE